MNVCRGLVGTMSTVRQVPFAIGTMASVFWWPVWGIWTAPRRGGAIFRRINAFAASLMETAVRVWPAVIMSACPQGVPAIKTAWRPIPPAIPFRAYAWNVLIVGIVPKIIFARIGIVYPVAVELPVRPASRRQSVEMTMTCASAKVDRPGDIVAAVAATTSLVRLHIPVIPRRLGAISACPPRVPATDQDLVPMTMIAHPMSAVRMAPAYRDSPESFARPARPIGNVAAPRICASPCLVVCTAAGTAEARVLFARVDIPA